MSNYESKNKVSSFQNSEGKKVEEINKNQQLLNSSIKDIKGNY